MTLTKAQKQALSILSEHIFKCAYEMGVSLSTLEALHKKGLIERKSDLGAMAFPRCSIGWRKKK